MEQKKEVIERETVVPIQRKCELLGVARSTIYYRPKDVENDDLMIINEIEDIYREIPIYGYRRITIELRKRGFCVNHKRTQRLMQQMGRRAIYPAKKTTIRNKEHQVFKYLLRDIKIDKVNRVWQVDITYILVKGGFVYLTCLIDVFSRKIMGRSLSTFLDTASCLDVLNNALKHAKPDIVNSDQGCQFTSTDWVSTLEANGILISMDGKGRWADNIYIERLWRTIKNEVIPLHRFDSVEHARIILDNFITFYNSKRFHQALNYHTPDAVYSLNRIPTKKELFESFVLQKNEYERKDKQMY